MGLKVVVIGGGSTYTPELIDGLARRADRLPIDELVLHDIDSERLAVVGGLAERMLRRSGWSGRLTQTTDREAAIDGADFVLVQLRIGGQAARLVDETLPLRFGTIGQETTGAGGFAKALRTIPVVLELADLTRRTAASGAWMIDFTNPVGIVTQALLDAGQRAIGLCNVAINIQRDVARRLGVDPQRVDLEQVGLNHLSWVRHARVDGVDRLPELLASQGDEIALDMDLPAEAFHRLGAIPSYYLRYYYSFAEVLGRQQNGHSRAEEVADIERRLLEMYRDPTLDVKPALLADRGGAFYSEVAAQLLASLNDGRGDVQVVDVRNDGSLPGLPDGDVVEIPARIDHEGAHPLPQAAMPDEIADLVRAVKRYERLTVKAALSGDRDEALAALSANPLVGPHTDPEPLLDALLEANRRFLPAFFGVPTADMTATD
jgi:6-phospho-beta-glucosidase